MYMLVCFWLCDAAVYLLFSSITVIQNEPKFNDNTIINTLYPFSPIIFFLLSYYASYQDNCANDGCQKTKSIKFTFQKSVVY